jgi:hypothetical protein
MAHLGDMTEDAAASSFQSVGQAFDVMDSAGAAYSVLAGNHDVSGDDTRGRTPYLTTMGPQRFKKSKTFAGSDSSGYNTAHVFTAGGQEWLLLALDWWTSSNGFAWANQFIKANPKLPVILTTHEIAGPTYGDNVYPYQSGDAENDASLSSYGQTVWNELINENDQVFLTLNGHYWPPGRTTLQNAAGNDVNVHITNYQNRYFGGAAMLRLYHFDLSRNTIDVETISPWALAQNQNVLAAQEARLTTTVDRFSVPINVESRFSSFIPPVVKSPRPAKAELLPGTLAYWRFDADGANGTAVTASQTIKDLSGHGGGRPAKHGDLQERLHHRDVREDPAGLERQQQLVGLGTQPLGRERAGRQERRQHRPAGADLHPQLLRRPRAAARLLPDEPDELDDALGPGPAGGHLVAPRRCQRRQAHHHVRRGLPHRRRRQPGLVQRDHPAQPALGTRRLRVRRLHQPDLLRLGGRRPHCEPGAPR